MAVELIVSLIAATVAVLCVFAGAYIWYVYSQRNEDAPFLTRLVHRDIRVAAASAVIAGLVCYSYIKGPLDRPWGAVVIGVALIAMMLGPIDDGVQWFRERRSARGK